MVYVKNAQLRAVVIHIISCGRGQAKKKEREKNDIIIGTYTDNIIIIKRERPTEFESIDFVGT